LLFPAVTEFSVDAAIFRYADCARAIGLATVGTGDRAATHALVDGLAQLCHDLEVPTPSTYGISRADWERLTPTMAQQALASGAPNNNPRHASAAEITELYARIYE
jgi:alcohol dehydrogenase